MFVSFGEMMMRLSPPGVERFEQAEGFVRYFGGAEANTAIALSQWGEETSFVSVLPDNPLGRACKNELRRWGVGVKDVHMDASSGARLGLYFCENGVSKRPSQVVYDRAGSSFAGSKAICFDWNRILQGAGWFHFTGITPALGKEQQTAVLNACRTAKGMGIPVSCDLNYRSALWGTKEASEVMQSYLPYITLLIANAGSARDVLGIGGGLDAKEPLKEAAKAAREIAEQYSLPAVAMTARRSYSASHNGWQGLLLTEGKEYYSKAYDIEVAERIGGGDSFAAGLIYGLKQQKGPQYAVDFAAAASCLKHTVPGDYLVASVQEAEQLMASDTVIMPKR